MGKMRVTKTDHSRAAEQKKVIAEKQDALQQRAVRVQQIQQMRELAQKMAEEKAREREEESILILILVKDGDIFR